MMLWWVIFGTGRVDSKDSSSCEQVKEIFLDRRIKTEVDYRSISWREQSLNAN